MLINSLQTDSQTWKWMARSLGRRLSFPDREVSLPRNVSELECTFYFLKDLFISHPSKCRSREKRKGSARIHGPSHKLLSCCEKHCLSPHVLFHPWIKNQRSEQNRILEVLNVHLAVQLSPALNQTREPCSRFHAPPARCQTASSSVCLQKMRLGPPNGRCYEQACVDGILR